MLGAEGSSFSGWRGVALRPREVPLPHCSLPPQGATHGGLQTCWGCGAVHLGAAAGPPLVLGRKGGRRGELGRCTQGRTARLSVCLGPGWAPSAALLSGSQLLWPGAPPQALPGPPSEAAPNWAWELSASTPFALPAAWILHPPSVQSCKTYVIFQGVPQLLSPQ